MMNRLARTVALSKAQKQHPSDCRRRLAIECLEGRLLLAGTDPLASGSPLPAPGDPAAISSTLDLAPAGDNTLYESSTGALSNGAGEHFFAGRIATGNLRRGLIRFDVAGNVPAGSTIDSVELTLHMSKTRFNTAQTVGLHEALADWGEGASDAAGQEGSGAAAAAGDATWIHTFFNTANWASDGGDFDATASATQNVGRVGDYTWGSTPQMLADVQAWLDDPGRNFGWLLMGNETTNTTAKRFDTKENLNTTARPVLSVAFTTPPPLELSIGDVSVVEGDAGTVNAVFPVTLSQPADQTVTVNYATADGAATGLSTVRVASGLSRPVLATSPSGDNNRLFIAEQHTGRIKILDLNTGLVNATPFLDIDGLSTGNEQGLLGMAFHPDYASNGLFYVNFTDSSGTTNIRRYRVSAGDPDVADPASARTVLTYGQPQSNHNGGWLGFGPDDYLYISTGDGGGGNDSGTGHTSGSGNSQGITDNLLGKMLRIDVDVDDFPGDPNRNYAIPVSNPLVGVTGDDEIWAYGLRNPWRASFDRATGDLYIADVGQNAREEIDVQPAASAGGENYGWRLREGIIETPTGGVGGTRPAGAIDPVYDYSHGSGPTEGFSVTGGYVYRGPIDELQGLYFFADFVTDRVWSFRFDGSDPSQFDGTNFVEFTDWTDLLVPDAGTVNDISSFGEDALGNLYIVDLGGEVFRMDTGADYAPTSGVLTFAQGESQKAIVVPVIGDTLDEIDENFFVNLSGATGAVLADGQAEGTILDDDPPPPATIVGRHVFYNNSAFDGNDATANGQDDEAIALDKEALLPGETATAANFTSYSRGINGVMVDIAGLAGTPSAGDFQFRVGNINDPQGWQPTAPPTEVHVRADAGAGGADRVSLVWENEAVTNGWLEVTVRTDNTGLAEPDVFYFANMAGDGNGDGVTDLTDFNLWNAAKFTQAGLDAVADFDRSGAVDLSDFNLWNANKFTSMTTATNPVPPDAAGQQSNDPTVAINELAWLRELDRTRAKRPSDASTLTARAVDRLLATYWE